MQKINWENGELIKEASVTIDDVEYEVTPRQTRSGTPLSADNLNLMQDNIESEFNNMDDSVSQIKNYLNLYSKRLWAGNADEGDTITIQNGSLYSAYILMLVINGGTSDEAIPVICGRVEQGNYISNGAVLNATASSFNTYGFIAENLGIVSGTNNERWSILGINHLFHNASGNHSAISSPDKIVEVIGLTPYAFNVVKNKGGI